MDDPYNLARFVLAQASAYVEALNELAAGKKASHWMWFVFPQIKGLGQSAKAKYYALQSLEEAHAYLHHEILGPRLVTCTNLVNQIEGKTAFAIFGSPDDIKFRSCMTLFAQVTPPDPLFTLAIDKFFEGFQDTLTLKLLSQA